MKVLKFGGTSLGSAERMKSVANIALKNSPVLVVLSAVSGITDSLVNISEVLKTGNADKVLKPIQQLRTYYHNYISELYQLEENRIKARKFVEIHFQEIIDLSVETTTLATEFHVLAKGEIISTELFCLLLTELKQSGYLLSSLDFLRLNQDAVPDEDFLKDKLNNILDSNPEYQVYIAQGFICRNAFGELSNLKRGGSDYSASLFAAAIDSEELQIWTDIDGMHNNDPRFIQNTKPIKKLSFDEAAELAYFGAKILHPSSVKPARRKNIPVKLLNTLVPEAAGTLITSESSGRRVKAVAAKNGITAIKIRSSEMLQAPGFLRRIFEVFELYQTSIDVITTSEVAVSVTIDDVSNLQQIIETLNEFGHVEVDSNLAIICVVGEGLVENTGVVTSIVGALKDIPLRMISFGGSAHNITLLISEELKMKALKSLHRELFDV